MLPSDLINQWREHIDLSEVHLRGTLVDSVFHAYDCDLNPDPVSITTLEPARAFCTQCVNSHLRLMIVGSMSPTSDLAILLASHADCLRLLSDVPSDLLERIDRLIDLEDYLAVMSVTPRQDFIQPLRDIITRRTNIFRDHITQDLRALEETDLLAWLGFTTNASDRVLVHASDPSGEDTSAGRALELYYNIGLDVFIVPWHVVDAFEDGYEYCQTAIYSGESIDTCQASVKLYLESQGTVSLTDALALASLL